MKDDIFIWPKNAQQLRHKMLYRGYRQVCEPDYARARSYFFFARKNFPRRSTAPLPPIPNTSLPLAVARDPYDPFTAPSRRASVFSTPPPSARAGRVRRASRNRRSSRKSRKPTVGPVGRPVTASRGRPRRRPQKRICVYAERQLSSRTVPTSLPDDEYAGAELERAGASRAPRGHVCRRPSVIEGFATRWKNRIGFGRAGAAAWEPPVTGLIALLYTE